MSLTHKNLPICTCPFYTETDIFRFCLLNYELCNWCCRESDGRTGRINCCTCIPSNVSFSVSHPAFCFWCSLMINLTELFSYSILWKNVIEKEAHLKSMMNLFLSVCDLTTKSVFITCLVLFHAFYMQDVSTVIKVYVISFSVKIRFIKEWSPYSPVRYIGSFEDEPRFKKSR